MRSRRLRRVAIAVCAVLTLTTVAAGCSNGDDGADHDPAIAATVMITDGEFDPRVVEIEPGGTVMWINEDDVEHSLRFMTPRLDSPRMRQGRSWVHTFSTSGRFRYFDPVRNTMKGVVVVRPAS
jgi:plastocyanin